MKQCIFILKLFLVVFAKQLNATCINEKLSLEYRISSSSFTCEATVLSKSTFLKEENIYTKYLIKVFKNFIQEEDTGLFFCLDLGGRFENTITYNSKSLNIIEGENYLLLANVDFKERLILPVFGSQSFIKLTGNTLFDSGDELNFNIDIIPLLFKKKGVFIERKNDDITSLRSGSMSISGISPMQASAGNNAILTIEGSGFGTSKGNGRVLFRNSNDGGSTLLEINNSEYISWTDSRIQVRIPSFAGTGSVRVEKNNAVANSPLLNISWSRVNYIDNNRVFRPVLSDESETGGYIFSVNSKLIQNDSLFERIKDAFEIWRCNTGINFSVSTAQKHAAVANIRYAIQGELAQGVLALCKSNFITCNGNDWYVSKMELLIRDSAELWSFTKGAIQPGKFDFLSVIAHELGHGIQLGHVISSQDMMHYSISRGVNKRTLNDNNITGAKSLIDFATKIDFCERKPMKPISTLCNDPYFTFYSDSEISIYPNPTGNFLYIDFFLNEVSAVQLSIFNMMGNRIFLFDNPSQEIGIHSKLIDIGSENIPGGIYLVKLKRGNSEITRKVVFTR